MRCYYDTEFLEDGRTIELISIGMVREDGAEYYAVSEDATKRKLRRRIKKNDWLMANVVPSLPKPSGDANLYMPDRWLFNYSDPCVKPPGRIANEVAAFILGATGYLGMQKHLELWADYGAYDHVVLCQLWGRMIDLPDGVPMWTHDLQQEAERVGIDGNDLPSLPVTHNRFGPHNALHDAREVRFRHQWLNART